MTLTASAGTIVDLGGGVWSWSFEATDGPDDSQTVSITATDSDAAATITFDLLVENVAPRLSVDHQTVTVIEGETATNTGTLHDPGDDTLTLARPPPARSSTTATAPGAGRSQPPTTPPIRSRSRSPRPTATALAATITFELVVENAAPELTVDQAAVNVDEGELATNSGTYHDPGDDSVTLTVSAGTIVDHGDGAWSWSLATTDGPDDSQVITVTATDSDARPPRRRSNLPSPTRRPK